FHLAQCSQTSTVLLATAKPRHVQRIATQGSVICHFKEHVSTALESSAGWLSSCLFPVASTFVTIPLTVERRIFSSKEISWMDLLHRWQPITGPRLHSLSS
ncbi:unnamed protein product, partial [Staurois parvus]